MMDISERYTSLQLFYNQRKMWGIPAFALLSLSLSHSCLVSSADSAELPYTVLPTPYLSSQPTSRIIESVPPSASPSRQKTSSPLASPAKKKTSSPSTFPSSVHSNIPSPTSKASPSPSSSPSTTNNRFKERVLAKVVVNIASVPKLMDPATQSRLEGVLSAWLEKLFLLNDPPITEISTFITSQRLETAASSSSRRNLRFLQNASGYKVKLGIDISGLFTPTPTVLSPADLNFQEKVLNAFQDHRLTAILLGMIQEYALSDPSNQYFSNVFMVQTVAATPSNKTSSSPLVGVMKIVVGSVSGGVGAVIAIVLILIWRERRKRRTRAQPTTKSPARNNIANDRTNPNTPDRDDVASVSDADATPIQTPRMIKNYYEKMDDSDSVVDFSVFSIPDISIHATHQQDPLDDDAEMNWNHDGRISGVNSFDSMSLPSYSEFGIGNKDEIDGQGFSQMDTNSMKSIGIGRFYEYNEGSESDPRFSSEGHSIMTSHNTPVLNPLSCIQEMSEFKDDDDKDSLPKMRLHQLSSLSDRDEILYIRSDDSVSLNTYDHYSVTAISCIHEMSDFKEAETAETKGIFKSRFPYSESVDDESSVDSISVSSLSLKSKDVGSLHASIFKTAPSTGHDSIRSFPSLNQMYSYTSTGSNHESVEGSRCSV